MIRLLTIPLLCLTFGAWAQDLSHPPGFYSDAFYLKRAADASRISGELTYATQVAGPYETFPDSLLIDQNICLQFRRTSSAGQPAKALGSSSYFIGLKTGFKVVSLHIDDDHLFDPITGLYERGPRAKFDTIEQVYIGANYVKKWERDCHVEIFDQHGQRIVNQAAGLRIFGGMSRHYPEKSLRLIARKSHGEPTFDADVFGQGAKPYKHLVLRHSGNDYRALRFKDAFLTALAAKAGLDVQASSPSHLYVNSEYWGIYNIREKINQHFLANNYNIQHQSVDILQGSQTVQEGSKEDYVALRNYVSQHPLSDEEHYRWVQQRMDTRSFINFWIHQIHFANHDARGNIRFWKSDELDGKFRWILYDTDLAFIPSMVRENTLADFTSSTMTDWYNPRWATMMLRNLLENETFHQEFILQATLLLNTTLGTKQVESVIDQFRALYEPEMPHHFQNRRAFQSRQGSLDDWYREIEKLRAFAQKRPPHIYAHLKKSLGLKTLYQLDIEIINPSCGAVHLNENAALDGGFSGKMSQEIGLPIRFAPNLGYRVEGSVEDTIRYTAASRTGQPDSISLHIRFLRIPDSTAPIVINELDGTLSASWGNELYAAELFNQDSLPVALDGWKWVDGRGTIYTIADTAIAGSGFFVLPAGGGQTYKLFDGQGGLVDSVACVGGIANHGFSRTFPFDHFLDSTSVWHQNSSASIGSHNRSYLNYFEEISERRRIKAEREWKNKRTAYMSAGLIVALLAGLLGWRLRLRRRRGSGGGK